MTIDMILEKQIRGAILRLERKFAVWPKEKSLFETRYFKIRFLYFMPTRFTSSAETMYSIIDKRDNNHYHARHYLGNYQYDRSKGWYIWEKE